MDEDDLARLYNALMIARHTEPVIVPGMLILEKIRCKLEHKQVLRQESLVLLYDITERVLDEPLIWTFIEAVGNSENIEIKYGIDKTSFVLKPKAVVFNDQNGNVCFEFTNTSNSIDVKKISSIKYTSSDIVQKKRIIKEKDCKYTLSFRKMTILVDDLKKMFPEERIESCDNGIVRINCQNYKNFILLLSLLTFL